MLYLYSYFLIYNLKNVNSTEKANAELHLIKQVLDISVHAFAAACCSYCSFRLILVDKLGANVTHCLPKLLIMFL